MWNGDYVGKIDSKQLTDKIQTTEIMKVVRNRFNWICTTVDCKLSEEELLSLGKGFSGESEEPWWRHLWSINWCNKALGLIYPDDQKLMLHWQTIT